MANNDDVTLIIGAQDKATAVVDKVAGKVGSFGASFKALGPIAVGVGTAVAGAAAAFGTLSVGIDLVAASAEKITAVTKAAQGIGSSVSDLQALQVAVSSLTGGEPDELVDALKEMQLRLGEMASGIGSEDQINVMKKLGLDPATLAAMSPVDQFKQIRDAISELQNVSERAVVGDLLFGGDSVRLLPAFLADVEKFDETLRRAASSGAVLSEQQAAGVEGMNRELAAAQANFDAIVMQATAALAPAIEVVAGYINDWLPPLLEVSQEILPHVVDALVMATGYAVDFGRAMIAASNFDVTGTIDAINKIGSTSEKLLNDINAARERSAKAAKEAADQRENRSGVSLRIGEDKNAVASAAAAEAAEKAKAEAARRTVEQLERQLAVAQFGEDAVKRQEELALARNDAERQRIGILQSQIDKQEAFNKAAEEAAKKQEKARDDAAKAQEQARAEAKRAAEDTIANLERQVKVQRFGEDAVRKQEELATARNAEEREKIRRLQAQVAIGDLSNLGGGSVQATQGRLLTRGSIDRTPDRIAKATELTAHLMGQLLAKSETDDLRDKFEMEHVA